MKNTSIFKYFLIVMLLFVLFGCNDNTVDTGDSDNQPYIYVITDNITVYAGNKKEIKYYVEGLTDYKIKMEVENEEIAKVENGYVVGITEGETKVRISVVDNENINGVVKVRVIGGKSASKAILEWVLEKIGTELVSSVSFPKTHPYYENSTITYSSSDTTVLSNTGIINPKEYDVDVIISIKIEYSDDILYYDHKVTVISSIAAVVYKDFMNLVGSEILKDININSFIKKYEDEYNITFSSSNEKILTNQGKFYQPDNDEKISLYLEVESKTKDYKHIFVVNTMARGLDIIEKTLLVKEEVVKTLGLDKNYYRLSNDIDLPTSSNRFGGTITWSSSNPDVVTIDGKINPQLVNTMVELKATFTQTKGLSASFSFLVEVLSKGYTDKWSAIEEFLNNYIYKKEIEVFKYLVTGVGPSYTAYNDGYLLFYVNQDLEITQDLLPEDHAFRPKTKIDLKYITIHDTAGNTLGAGVLAQSRYIHSEYTDETKKEKRPASSWHFTIDDTLLYQHIPLDEIAWHAGTSEGNRTSIGIETCTNPDSDYDVVMLRTAKLVAMLLDKFNLTISNVKQHRDWSGKNCPQVIIQNKRWQELLNLIAIELFGRQYLSDVKFEWESLNKEIMNDQGIVINHPGNATNISYKVKVTYNNETREYTFTSLLQEKKK